MAMVSRLLYVTGGFEGEPNLERSVASGSTGGTKDGSLADVAAPLEVK